MSDFDPLYPKRKPKFKYKMKTCAVCGREYKARPLPGKNGGVIYRDACPYCGVEDFARDSRGRGHLEIPEHEE